MARPDSLEQMIEKSVEAHTYIDWYKVLLDIEGQGFDRISAASSIVDYQDMMGYEDAE